MSKYAVLDFETTGLSAKNGDRAIEIGIVIVQDGEIHESYQSLINPGQYISGEITSITGITNKMVKHAPSPQKVFKEVNRFVDGATLVAHNAAFDRRFWQSELPKVGLDADHDFLCTLLLSRRLYPDAYNHKLRTLVEMHGLDTDGTYHRALADASMTARLLQRILNDLSAAYPEDSILPPFLSRYQKLPKAKTRTAPAVIKRKPVEGKIVLVNKPRESKQEAPIDVEIKPPANKDTEASRVAYLFTLLFVVFVLFVVFGR